MENISIQTKKIAKKLETLKQKAKIEKDKASLLEKVEEVRELKLINKQKRGKMKSKKIRI